MFTGIIENVGIVQGVRHQSGNIVLQVECPFADELKIDQSLSHNGVCLTVESVTPPTYQVTAIRETLQKTNLGSLKQGSVVNLERCMVAGARLDGHLVTGHIEAMGECIAVQEMPGSWEYRFRFPAEYGLLVVEKGSICLNGISLTIYQVTDDEFSVAIIPYTYDHTNIKEVNPGSMVNLEFDIIGKYVQRNLAVHTHLRS